ncbi:HAMP domain-containing sensor histidine kinase [Sphingobacterium sp.]|uniref:sensor histidine kinase n=1 Tax=Sphingobacterium sp. TaxID=341027 RepID=UPI0028AF38AF|nr:HAMP domain-containing sensor histidine kinase [Sphingobacterium sp.]MBV2228671.1 HAMP domain-containing histidine kinase [Sphingobacterium mizutaii]
MLKKYKILLASIVLTIAGIIVVLGFWLFGSYFGHKQFFLGMTEHELFDVVQDFYSENEEQIQKENQNQRKDRIDRLSIAFKEKYPQINVDTIKSIFENQNFNRKNDRQNGSDSTGNSKSKMSRHFISSYVVRTINWNEATIDSLQIRLEKSLRERDMYSPFILQISNLPNEEERNKEFYHQRYKESKSRPIVIDQSENLYLEVDYINPTVYLLKQIGWQLFFSLILIIALIGTFWTLLVTIRKQNQLAKMRKAFVNNMTHELKTPVSTVMAAIESIQRYGAKDDKERMNRYLSISRQELEHLSDMIERVLQVDVAETNGVLLEKTWFDLDNLIDESMENAKLFAKKEVDIQKTLTGDSFQIFADQAHIKNVINNLLDNAIKYAGDQVKINIALSENGDRYTLSIQDNGIGIPKAYQKGVFDLFFRVPSGNIHNVKGFGLGLAYVKQIVQQHQGTIDLSSEEAVGSTFVIDLPKQS